MRGFDLCIHTGTLSILMDKNPKSPKIIDVIPIARGMMKESLSYFTSQTIQPGSLISVPLRNAQIKAIAIRTVDASERKADLRSSDFTLKKLTSAKHTIFFSSAYIKMCERVADHFISTTGAAIWQLNPTSILEKIDSLPPPKKIPTRSQNHEKFILQSSHKERMSQYKSIIREEFAKKQSVIILFPSVQAITEAGDLLNRGIENYVFKAHSSLKKEEILQVWKSAILEKHPIVILSTPQHLGIPRNDIGTIIVEEENATGYTFQSRPYIDAKIAARFFAEEAGIRLIVGDTLSRSETIWEQEQGKYTELIQSSTRIKEKAEAHLLDMRTPKDARTKKFTIISNTVTEAIKDGLVLQEKMFIFNARRGLAPITVCTDCGTVVECTKCSAPTTLHTYKEKTFFLCHKCGDTRSAEETCKKCGGWNLTTLGIGIEKVEEELTKKFPEATIIRLDKDSVKTRTQAQKKIQQFYQNPKAILLGTEMALPFLKKQIHKVAIISLDSLFSLPEFRIEEKVARLLLTMYGLAEKKFFVQTRDPEKDIFSLILSGNLRDFYEYELSNRKQFGYPPYTALIKITRRGKRPLVERDMERLEKHFTDYGLISFPAFTSVVKGLYTMHALIKVPHETWPDQQLIEMLKELPPFFTIRVNPESIL